MKKRCLLTLGVSAVLFLAACGAKTPAAGSSAPTSQPTSSEPTSSKPTSSDATIYATALSVDSETVSLKVGASHQVTATVTPENVTTKGVTYASDKEAVATVSSDGLIQGVSAGSATITVTSKSLNGASGTALTKTIAVTVSKSGIADIKALGDVDVKAVIAAVTSKGYVLDDGTGSIYCYTALDAAFKLGDYVSAKVTVSPYFAIWEGTAVADMTKLEGTAPTLKDPTALTAAIVTDWTGKTGTKTETEAAMATTETGPFSFTATAMLDNSFTYFTVDGSTTKLEPSGLASDIEIITGVKYDIVAYTGGYNSSKSYASLYVKSATPKYETITGVSVTGSAEVYTGESTQLTATAAPTGADPHVTWASSDTKVATVDAKGLVTGVAAGSVTITATSVADSTKSGSLNITVSVNNMVSLAAYDFSKIPAAPSTKPYGALDAAGVLAYFTDTSATKCLTSGTNPITVVTTATAAYQANNSQGPAITGLKLGAKASAGKLVLTSSADIVKVSVEVRAWGADKLATITINGTATALVAADATTARKISVTFDAAKTITIESSIYSVVTGMQFFGPKA